RHRVRRDPGCHRTACPFTAARQMRPMCRPRAPTVQRTQRKRSMIAKIRLRSGILRRRATNLVGFDSSAILRAASPALLMAPQATERSLRSSSIIDRAGSISPAESLRVRTNPHGRLIIRALVPDDVAVIHARRNNPDVARLQNWEVPFPLERAQDLVDTCIALGEPTDGEWWNAMVTLPD